MQGIVTGKEWPLMSGFRALFDQPAPGYRPGATLERALRELRGRVRVTSQDAAGAVLTTQDGGVTCAVREHVERHLLMHIVVTEFTVSLPGTGCPGAVIDVTHTGAVSRTGIACTVPAAHRTSLKSLTERIQRDRALNEVLLRLNFRRCRLTDTADGWTLLIEPYGASEVVNRMPSFRRYIPLGSEHAEALVRALEGFCRALSPSASS